MKHFLLFGYLSLFGLLAGAQTVNNVKLLDLTSNTNTGTTSFFVPIGSQMQVTSDYTFEAWVYVDGYGYHYWSRIMDRRTVFSFYFVDKPSGTSGDFRVRFAIRDNSDNAIAELRSDTTGTSGHATDYITVLQEWYHIAVSRANDTARLFINGHMVDYSDDALFELSTPTGNDVNVGARYWGSYERFLDGALDEVRYSDVGRYSQDFTININTPPHPTSGDPNTILLFNFDQSNLDNSTSANSYTASAHGTLSYANWDGFPADKLPLPLSWKEPLNGWYEDGQVVLCWQTASERNNRGFIVQRSSDGKRWDSLGFVQGAGNSNIALPYRFYDHSPLEQAYYRLCQVDFNGLVSYSKIIRIEQKSSPEILLYPNPAKGHFFLKYLDPRSVKSIGIYDIGGRLIRYARLYADNLLVVDDLQAGYYYLIIEGWGYSRKVMSFVKK